MRLLLLMIVGLAVFVIAAVTIYLSPDSLRHCTAPESAGACARADAIVTVSGGDTNARVDEAVHLYKEGWADTLIFSGAAADKSGPSNAEAMERRALGAGVPKDKILVEELSRTTAENAQNTSQFIAEQSVTRIILVTSAYHQRRAYLEFGQTLGPAVTILNHPAASDRQWNGIWWWTTGRGWWLAGSELIKILAFYSAKGASSL